MQSKLGTKLSIMLDRLLGVNEIHGPEHASAGPPPPNAGVRVTQPLAPPGHQPSQADHMDHGQLVPANRSLTTMPKLDVPPLVGQEQKSPDFNQMYQGQNNPTPLPNAASPVLQEPVAANDMLGGFGGSPWS